MSGTHIHAHSFVLSPFLIPYSTQFTFSSRRVERHKHENDMFTEIDHKRELLGKSWN